MRRLGKCSDSRRFEKGGLKYEGGFYCDRVWLRSLTKWLQECMKSRIIWGMCDNDGFDAKGVLAYGYELQTIMEIIDRQRSKEE